MAWDEESGGSTKQREALGYTRLTLEDILTAWARDEKAFARVDKHFAPYVDALLTHDGNLTPVEKADLKELSLIWTLARTKLTS